MEKRFDFDELTRVMASGLPRREALRRLGGGLAGALLASFGLGTTASSAPATNSLCESFCRDHCGIDPGGGNAHGKCVSSCQQCVHATGELPCGCPSFGSTDVVCCASGEFCCFGHDCCASVAQCDTESLICFS